VSGSGRAHGTDHEIRGDELVAVLIRAGFALVRIRGSHHFLKHQDGRQTVVPVHSGEVIGPAYSTRFCAIAD